MRILPRPEAADPSATEFTTIMRITFSSNNSGTVKTGVITINAGVSSSPGGQTYPVVIDYRQE